MADNGAYGNVNAHGGPPTSGMSMLTGKPAAIRAINLSNSALADMNIQAVANGPVQASTKGKKRAAESDIDDDWRRIKVKPLAEAN